GLGRALVPRFAALGHTVVGCGRSPAHVGELGSAFPRPHRFDVIDVREWGAVHGWAVETVRAVGPPDLLINNAALMNVPAPLWEVGHDEFSNVVDVNVPGAFNVLRSFVPAMVERSE